MAMINAVIVGIVGLLAYVLSVPAISETVWLKDITKIFQGEKRTLGDFDLPDHLNFHLRRGSDALTLNLRRNYDIDPNGEIYVVQKLNNGRSVLTKTQNMINEDVAYYQDMANVAYMTVRCVRTLDQQCERVIYGNIQIGDRLYDLLPAERDVTSGHVLKDPGLYGTRYVLQDPGSIKPENFVEHEDTSTVLDTNIEEELLRLQQRFSGQDKTNQFPPVATISYYQHVADLRRRLTKVNTRSPKKNFYVDVAVLIDAGIWDRYSSTVQTSYMEKKRDLVQKKIREAYSYIMNGVNMLYKFIEDPRFAITVTLTKFVFFERESLFPHKNSRVQTIGDKNYIDIKKLFDDLHDWDVETGSKQLPIFDHAMLFTSNDLYRNLPSNNEVHGVSETIGVCIVGKRVSVIQAGDYVRTVLLATHELGHNLGADHDGEGRSADCNAVDMFIMTPAVSKTGPDNVYTKNAWLFSKCSLQSFWNILSFKQCVNTQGKVFNEDEWKTYKAKNPGEVYSLNEQCHHINGKYSKYCGTVLQDICHLMKCTDPKTGVCMPDYFSAARGTPCGQNMVCMEGRCIFSIGPGANSIPGDIY